MLIQFSSVQSLSRVWFFATPWIVAYQARLSITNSRSSLRLTSIKSVMPSSHFILCRPLLLLPPIPSSIRVFSNESTLRMRWPKYWSFGPYISVKLENIWKKKKEFLLSFLGECQQGKFYICQCFPIKFNLSCDIPDPVKYELFFARISLSKVRDI